MIGEERNESETVERAFRIALGRSPSDSEADACLNLWNDSIATESNKSYEARDWPDRIERVVMAEKTGQPYRFEEVMPAYSEYQPDTQPGEVDARTRALAQVCLVIFNLNEFTYLD